MTGHGALYYSNGGTLRGNFIDGKINGLGRGIYSNGDIYIGMWKKGMFHGNGLFYMKSTNNWQIGKFEQGTMLEVIGTGKGKPSSLGLLWVILIAIKSKLDDGKGGNTLNDLFCEGETYFDHYYGDIVDGARNGNGVFSFADGSFYSGMWKDNKTYGLGIFHYTDGKYDAGIYTVLLDHMNCRKDF